MRFCGSRPERGGERGSEDAEDPDERRRGRQVDERAADLAVAADRLEALAELAHGLVERSAGLTGLARDRRRRGSPNVAKRRGGVEDRHDGQDERRPGDRRPGAGPRNAKPTANDAWRVRLKTPIAVSS